MRQHYDLIAVGGVVVLPHRQQQGLNVLLVEEKVTTVGGNTVPSGVTYREMEAGDTSCPFEIYKRLKRIPQAVGIYSYGRYMLWRLSDQPAPYRGGEHHRTRAETTSTHCAITGPEACGKINSSPSNIGTGVHLNRRSSPR